ncbi:NUDIX domain-containing protein [Ramlibacter sp. GTP1]|uniref:NUDIX domain-containing protein n=1 Tax=Ramlibacter albus TaxID=2079448 RepID=A0A923MES7_9BURK|nr:NUDIX domain-containing protein [Ramlibacter albus]
MHPLAPGLHWLQQLEERAQRAPLRPRVPLVWRGAAIGSAEPPVLQVLKLSQVVERGGAFEIEGELGASLAAIAEALRDHGYIRAWRNEQLAVRDASGTLLATVERGAVRLLGIATQAVHLLGFSADGDHWVQQRSYDKPDDPGLWDTLMGGMVGASESVQDTLERETWEEAGLKLSQLESLVPGGEVVTRRPSANVPHGYVDEKLVFYRCVLPEGVEPSNMDGEVAQFRRMSPAEVRERLERLEFTIDASLMLVQP